MSAWESPSISGDVDVIRLGYRFWRATSTRGSTEQKRLPVCYTHPTRRHGLRYVPRVSATLDADMRLLAILCLAAADSGHALVDFPMSDSPQSATHPPDLPAPAPHLPFRRISLPSAPNLIQRQSIVSTVSIDSIPEGPRSAPLTRGASRGPRHRPSSIEAARRNRRREVKSVVLDEQREAKRRKVVHELYETERTYVDGLELIYSVRVLS